MGDFVEAPPPVPFSIAILSSIKHSCSTITGKAIVANHSNVLPVMGQRRQAIGALGRKHQRYSNLMVIVELVKRISKSAESPLTNAPNGAG